MVRKRQTNEKVQKQIIEFFKEFGVSKQTIFKFEENTAKKKEVNKHVNIFSRLKADTKKDLLAEKNENNIKKNFWKITKLNIKNKNTSNLKTKEEES